MKISISPAARRALQILAAALCLNISAEAQIQVGYTVITAQAGSHVPAGAALFSFVNDAGVLVSQAGVEARPPVQSGEIFVDEVGTQTGIALVNVSTQATTLNLVLRDPAAQEAGRASVVLPAGQQTSRYIHELFSNYPSGFSGSMTFDSSQPVYAVALRESRNAYGEPVYATLPVIDVSGTPGTDTMILPHLAAGGGYTTQLVLLNPGSRSMHGQIRLASSDGQPLQLTLDGNIATEFVYQIAPQGTYRAELDSNTGLSVGYAAVIPDAGTDTPSGTAIFRLQAGGQLVTEASVAATPPTTQTRIFVDNARSRTGVAIANSQNIAGSVTFKLLNRDGTAAASIDEALAASGHLSIFADELFPALTDGFTGVMEISSTLQIAAITLKLTVNSRGDPVLATLPVADLNRISLEASLVFPQIAIGGGFSTRLILINTDPASAEGGTLVFYQTDGSPLSIPLAGQVASAFPYQLTASGGREFYPGDTAAVASIRLIDPESNQVTTEVTVNEGNIIRARLQIVDSTGQLRDDFDAQYLSANPDVAVADASGDIQGKKAGFSTLTITAGGVITAVTVTVARIDSSPLGFEPTGIAQDQARRLYLAAAQVDAIFLTDDLTKTPAVYAGIPQSPGLKNDLRLQALFKNPAALALDQAGGNLFVSDSANHVIRRIQPGPDGRVETLAGTGQPGSQDGPDDQSGFNGPQGVALDQRGNVWVADSGNHTIRKINFATGLVETVAGKPGVAGFADGHGDAARFNSPTGIAVITESLAQQTDRQRRGAPPPPITLVVADTGNGAIRLITENQDVNTIAVSPPDALETSLKLNDALHLRRLAVTPPSAFSSPAGVAVDPFGNIYITDSKTHRLRVRLQNGQVVAVAQPNTFQNPNGIAVTATGSVVVTDGSHSALEIQYGEPQLASVTPSQISIRGGEGVTVLGNNFAPDTVVVLGGEIVTNVTVNNTQRLSFTAPAALPSGITTLTLQNRGGLAQTSMTVEALPLAALAVGEITTVAGGSTFAGDGSLATAGTLTSASGIALDSSGNLYLADTNNHRIRKVNAITGVITTVAGTGQSGFSGDGGPGTAAQLSYPWGVAVNSAGDLFISDNQNHRVRKLNTTTGIITTAAGTGQPGFSGEGGLAAAAMLSSPFGVAVDRLGNLLIADTGNYRIRKVDGSTGIIKTIAGAGNSGFSGDNGPATGADFAFPFAISIDAAGNVFVADTLNQRIRKISADTGTITTIAGSGKSDFSGDGGPASAAALHDPFGVAVDAAGNVFIADQENNRIRKVTAGTSVISTIAGTQDGGFSGDGGLAAAAELFLPYALLADGAGNLLVGDAGNHRVRRISATNQIITTIAGNGQPEDIGDNGPAIAATLGYPSALVINAAGDLVIADTTNHRIRKVDAATGTIVTVAGTGQAQFSGDGGLATAATLSFPQGVAVDGNGNVFIADSGNQRIRRMDSGTGIITTIAGGSEGFSGDNGPAAMASLDSPKGIAVDAAGNLFIADAQNNRIRKIDAASGIITTVAGNGQQTYSGDSGPATLASLALPTAVAIDGQGNLFIGDNVNSRVRKVAATTGIITTVAGDGRFNFAGDGGPAVAADLNQPYGLAFDAGGNIFIADQFNGRIRRVDAQTGVITTVAGSGQPGISGDGGPALNAALDRPFAVVIDSAGNVFIADAPNNRVRAVRGPVK